MLFHFLLGFWISKAGILKKINENKKFRKRLLITSLIVTAILIPFYFFILDDLYPVISKTLKFKWLIYSATRIFSILWYLMTTACVNLYATILISLASSEKGKKMVGPLAAFGQMALSNYLMQSLVLVPYFLLTNKFRTVSPTEGLLLFIVFFSLQLLFSTWWMKKYTMGPFEWVLRSFTYWKWQKIKRPTQNQFDDEKQLIIVSVPQY